MELSKAPGGMYFIIGMQAMSRQVKVSEQRFHPSGRLGYNALGSVQLGSHGCSCMQTIVLPDAFAGITVRARGYAGILARTVGSAGIRVRMRGYVSILVRTLGPILGEHMQEVACSPSYLGSVCRNILLDFMTWRLVISGGSRRLLKFRTKHT